MMNDQFFKDNNIEIHYDVPLSEKTTFKIGGACRAFIQCRNPSRLMTAVRFLRAAGQNFILIGAGSNIIVSDNGVDCPVIQFTNSRLVARLKNDRVTVWASCFVDDLAEFLAGAGWAGINFISGVPGTLGGAIAGNAGAFGRQIGDVVDSVRVIAPDNCIRTIPAQELEFAYRDSRIKSSEEIILSATLRLARADREALLTERSEILQQRRDKHPDYKITPCAGSFFRNLEPTSLAGRRQAAGWFLDQCGAKAMTVGGAAVFSKHANIIINPGKASAADVYNLSLKMAAAVEEKFRIKLSKEVRFLGDIESAGLKDKFW